MRLLGLGHRHGGASRGSHGCCRQPAVARPLGQDPFAPAALFSAASCQIGTLPSPCSYAGWGGCPPGVGPPATAVTSYDASAPSWWHSASPGTFCPNCPITPSA